MSTTQEDLDKLRVKHNKTLNQLNKLKREYKKLKDRHAKVMNAVHSLPMSVEDFIGEKY